MAEVTGPSGAGNRKSRGHRSPMPAPRIDMTPMVDLGFLLITFFMLSMKMGQPNAMEWDKRISELPPQPISECCVLNILIDSADQVFTYEGEDMKALKPSSFDAANGIEQVIMAKAKRVKLECGATQNGQPHKLICLIKLLPGCRYQNLTDAMDEMNITNTQYSIQEPLPEEVTALKEKESN